MISSVESTGEVIELADDGQFKVPLGFKGVKWADVENEQKVFIIGTYGDDPAAYGPFFVHDKDEKRLRNKHNQSFLQCPESLLIEQ